MSPARSRRLLGWLVLLLAASLAVACTGPAAQPGDGDAADTSRRAEPLVYVAVGASETVGIGTPDPAVQGWPAQLRATALPEARLVNVGVSGATAAEALAQQVPRAVAAEPDLATVWLAVNDAIAQVPVERYEQALRDVVHALRRGGETEVLVANVPRVWQLPVYRACLEPASAAGPPCGLPLVPPERLVRRLVADYNAAIARVVEAEGARLVDLSDQVVRAADVSADGFHPSTAGHRRVAAQFAAELPDSLS